MPTPADYQAWREAYDAVAPDPAHFDEFAAKTSAMVHEFPGWTEELRSLQVPTLLIFGDRDFSPLPDVAEMFELLPNAQLAVLPGTTHVGVTRRPGEVFALITPFLGACQRRILAHSARTRVDHAASSSPKAGESTDRVTSGSRVGWFVVALCPVNQFWALPDYRPQADSGARWACCAGRLPSRGATLRRPPCRHRGLKSGWPTCRCLARWQRAPGPAA